MNKKRVDGWVSTAYDAIISSGIAEKNEATGQYEVAKSFRGQVSAFGAAIVMGSLKSAVAFYSTQGNAKEDRAKLLVAIYKIITGNINANKNPTDIFNYIRDEEKKANSDIKCKVIDASIAIKLAMNLFHLLEEKK